MYVCGCRLSTTGGKPSGSARRTESGTSGEVGKGVKVLIISPIRVVAAILLSVITAALGTITFSRLEPSRGHIEGRVADVHNQAVGDVTVETNGFLMSEGGNLVIRPGRSHAMTQSFVAFTDKNGYYRFPDLHEGLYLISFTKQHYSTSRLENVVVLPNATAHVDMVMYRGAVEHTVTATQPSIPGARIRGHASDYDSTDDLNVLVQVSRNRWPFVQERRQVVSEFDGEFDVPGVRPGTYTVTFSRPGFYTIVVERVAVLPNSTAEIQVKMVADVQGVQTKETIKVVEPDGSEIVDVEGYLNSTRTLEYISRDVPVVRYLGICVGILTALIALVAFRGLSLTRAAAPFVWIGKRVHRVRIQVPGFFGIEFFGGRRGKDK